MDDSIFRKVSLERLSSPDQIDQLLRITNPGAWITVVGIFLLTFFFILWSIFGEISVKIEGKGMLMKSEGIQNIQHISGGIVQEILIAPGDFVSAGEVVARIRRMDTKSEYHEAQIRLKELENQHKNLTVFNKENMALQNKYFEQEKLNVEKRIKSGREKLKFKREYLHKLKLLEKEGGITKQQLFDAQQEYHAVYQTILKEEAELKQLTLQKNEIVKSRREEVISLERSINETKRLMEKLRSTLELSANVTSPYTGKIVEVMINEGALLPQGGTIASVEPADREDNFLMAVLYAPLTEGKNIQEGMEVQISPSTVKKEEYGYILGKVTSVSSYPATFQGMMKILGNETMVNTLSSGTPVITLRVELARSFRNVSGYQWSSRKGPNVVILGGTVCSGYITIEKRRPISFFLPMLKKTFSG